MQRRSNLLLILVIAMAFAFFSLGDKTEVNGPEVDLGTWTRRIHLTGGRRTEFFPHPNHGTSDQ